MVNYTQLEIQKLWGEIQDTLEALKEIEMVIMFEIKNPSSEPNMDNCLYIVPSIQAQYNDIRTKDVRIDVIVKLFSDWAEKLYSAVVLNKGKMRNKVLTAHLVQAHSVCGTLQKILEGRNKV